MKTTIKGHCRDIVVKPSPVGGMIELHLIAKGPNGGYMAGEVLTPEQCGALIFGIEQALACHDISKAAPNVA